MDQSDEFLTKVFLPYKNIITDITYITNNIDYHNRPMTPQDQPTDKSMPKAPKKNRNA